MTQPNSMLPSTNNDDNRQRALAKVYSFLLRLAVEADDIYAVSDSPTTEEKADATVQENSKKEI